MPIGIGVWAFCLENRLRRYRRIHSHLYAVFCLIVQSFLNFFVDILPAIYTFSLIGDGRLRARRGFIVDITVLVDVDRILPGARDGFRQYRAGFQVAYSLFELIDSLLHRLRTRLSRRFRYRFPAWNFENFKFHGKRLVCWQRYSLGVAPKSGSVDLQN